ncbi:ABC transporter ATP-binding protein [uncultured Microbacterium sp.]|uniref:ABC transporter ATP-binding protein n=1 Tax=uncultured Microbacterium sp. TaxID=191216 RepID=UPI002622E043|nr:ABC transporter ATP-binding protein [uncultured Microbacterium sp.]
MSPDNNTPVLLVEGLRKVYPAPTPQAEAVEAIRDLTFSIPQGQLVCIVGPSGAGKTTLLKCIAGLLPPTAGRLEIEGKAITGPPKTMAVVFQEYGRSLYPWMTVQGNVELPLKSAGIAKAERRRISQEALVAVGLADAGDKYPWQLSGGMQQRVAIARAVAYRPQILLMDEPFAAVDAQTRADLEDLVRKIWKDLGVTVLFVTHDIDESVYLGQRVIVLSNRPTVVQDDITIDLPDERDQLTTRSDPRFVELRHHIYGEIQRAKTNSGATQQASA